jgi:hypothetical protein
MWGENRLKLARKYGTLTRSKRYMEEVRKSFALFCSTRKEKVQFT